MKLNGILYKGIKGEKNKSIFIFLFFYYRKKNMTFYISIHIMLSKWRRFVFLFILFKVGFFFKSISWGKVGVSSAICLFVLWFDPICLYNLLSSLAVQIKFDPWPRSVVAFRWLPPSNTISINNFFPWLFWPPLWYLEVDRNFRYFFFFHLFTNNFRIFEKCQF